MKGKGGVERVGDEHRSLFDQYERLCIEIQLNQAILGRSLSEPSVGRSLGLGPPSEAPPLVSQVRQGRRSSLPKVLKKLLKSIFGRKMGGRKDESPHPNNNNNNNPLFCKAFSRSLRV
uniref:Uncharacterized protein n=1 Tax=Nelumbo nucifera TaxID=4432 RepID=A0A822Y2K2_NELNU|nr:TPA_asm: hypothetical protein HUJ06_027249 [Nelumbo nucifera]